MNGLEVLARGANRLCARDPVNPAHCLKFELAGPERTRGGLRARIRRWFGRRFARSPILRIALSMFESATSIRVRAVRRVERLNISASLSCPAYRSPPVTLICIRAAAIR